MSSTFRTRLISKSCLRSAASAAILLVHTVVPFMRAHADDYINPELVKVTTPFYKPVFEGFSPPLGTYNYTVSWEGITAASASVTVSEDGDRYKVDAAAKTYSGIDLLYKLRYSVNGVISTTDLSPVSLAIDHRENSTIKNISMTFAPNNGEVYAVRSRPDSTEKKQVRFNPHNLTLDPIGAGFLARSLTWKVGDVKTFDVFNGKSRYLITLTAVARQMIDFKGEQKDVFVISPRVKNLTTTKAVEKLREAQIYMTADKNRDILKIVSSVFIGSVTTELESFSPASTNPSPLQVARAKADEQARAQMR